MEQRPKKPELLAPAGSPEKLEYAIAYGADAVYLSGKEYGLRQAAGNFTLEEMIEAVKLARQKGKKIYVAVNVFMKNEDVAGLARYLKTLKGLEVDAIIVSDPGILRLAREHAPQLPVHLSTQANTLNIESVHFWNNAGVTRVSLARELTFREIEEITAAAEVEVEVFVHGAMCIAYSGRCLLSKYLANRDANRGDCAQACRWKYYLMEEKRPGSFYPVEEDEKGTYFFNSKDLCLIEYLPRLIEAGVHSFKIEGRTKSLHYLAAVTKVYRQAIDTYLEDASSYEYSLAKWRGELEKISHRPYSPCFVAGVRDLEETNSGSPVSSHTFVGIVGAEEMDGLFRVKIKNRLRVGQEVEILQPNVEPRKMRVERMIDCGSDVEISEAHANFEVSMPIEEKIEKYSILRRKTKD